jgi:hypothetical protein
MHAGRPLLLVALAACGPRGPAPAVPIAPAGDHRDDATGLLAHASTTLVTGPADDEDSADDADTDTDSDDPSAGGERFLRAYGGIGYGGLAYGGLAYGGLAYAGTAAGSSWAGMPAADPPSYDSEEDLTGAIEGVVTWQGAPPPPVAGACGSAQGSPTLHVARDRGVGGALVYIEKIDVGRVVPTYGHTISVGGVIVKHGCALLPAAQIVAPLPAQLTIYGDATAAKLRATAPTGATLAVDLQEGGLAHLDAVEGIVRVDSADGSLAPAWVVGLDSPYYAITDDAGRFRIDELAAGTYDVAIWQAPVAIAAPGGAVAYGAPIVAHRTITVALEHAARLDVENADVLGARTLGAATFVVRDLLALAKILEPHALDGGHVEKHVRAGAVLDETETLVREPLDRTFSHSRRSLCS